MRCVLVILSLCLLITSAQAGTFRDDFDDGNFDGWEILNFPCTGQSKWEVKDGVLWCEVRSICSAALVFGDNEWRNYSIECDARMLERFPNNMNTIGLDLRVMVPNNGSVVWLYASPGTAAIETWQSLQLMKKSVVKAFDLQLNKWYRLKGVVNEDNFEFYIDGVLMAFLSESRFPTGHVGLDIQTCAAEFDNVVIIGDDVPDNSQASVSNQGKLASLWGQMRSQ